MLWHRSLWQRHSKGHIYLKIICSFKCHQISGQFPLGSSPEICSRFILLNLKGGLFFRHLKQNRNVFQINIQRLESVRQSGKKNGASVFWRNWLVDDGAICLEDNFAYARNKRFCGSTISELKIIKVQDSTLPNWNSSSRFFPWQK